MFEGILNKMKDVEDVRKMLSLYRCDMLLTAMTICSGSSPDNLAGRDVAWRDVKTASIEILFYTISRWSYRENF